MGNEGIISLGSHGEQGQSANSPASPIPTTRPCMGVSAEPHCSPGLVPPISKWGSGVGWQPPALGDPGSRVTRTRPSGTRLAPGLPAPSLINGSLHGAKAPCGREFPFTQLELKTLSHLFWRRQHARINFLGYFPGHFSPQAAFGAAPVSQDVWSPAHIALEASEQVWHCWWRSHARCFLWLCKPSLSSGSWLKNDRGPVTNFKHYLEIRAESKEVRA